MTHQRWKSFLAPWAITAASVLSFTACSGHDDEEQVAPDSANNNANEEKADAPNEEAAGDTAGEAKAAADSTSESASASEGGEGGDATASAAASAETPAADSDETAAAAPASDTVASSEAAAPAAAPAGAAAAPAPAPASAAAPAPAGGSAPAQAQAQAAAAPAGPAGRVVRYIQVDQTGLHSQASDASPVTMRLAQGDILMVLEENGWGRITDELFVKLDAVSNRAVPRLFEKPDWQAPAH